MTRRRPNGSSRRRSRWDARGSSQRPSTPCTRRARGYKWVKLKRDYQAEMSDTVDLVAVGGLAGRGKRAGTWGALLMAAYDKPSDTFKTVCKLGTGFTDELLAGFPERFGPARLEHRHARVDSTLEADAWFEPKHVMEVLGSEIT